MKQIYFSFDYLFHVEAITRLTVGQSLNCCCFCRRSLFHSFRPFCRFLDVSKNERERALPHPSFSFSPSKTQQTHTHPHTHNTHAFCFGACLKRIASVHGKLPHTPLFNFIVARKGIRNPLSNYSLSLIFIRLTHTHITTTLSLSQICTLTYTQKF